MSTGYSLLEVLENKCCPYFPIWDCDKYPEKKQIKILFWITVIEKDIVHHSRENTVAETMLASHIGSALMGREGMRSGAAL